MAWRSWGDHPIVVTIIVFCAILGTGYLIYDHHFSNKKSQDSNPVDPNQARSPLSSPKSAVSGSGNVVIQGSNNVVGSPVPMAPETSVAPKADSNDANAEKVDKSTERIVNMNTMNDVVDDPKDLSPHPAPFGQTDKPDDQSGRCNSYQQFRAPCKDGNAKGASATISILPCDMVRINEIRISDASGHDYRIDKNSTTFEVPPGNKDRSSKVEIFYESLSDDRVRVKSILVNNFGQCLP